QTGVARSRPQVRAGPRQYRGPQSERDSRPIFSSVPLCPCVPRLCLVRRRRPLGFTIPERSLLQCGGRLWSGTRTFGLLSKCRASLQILFEGSTSRRATRARRNDASKSCLRCSGVSVGAIACASEAIVSCSAIL